VPLGDESRIVPTTPDPRCLQIVQLRLEGCTYGEIAARLKCDPKTVWKLRQEHDLDAMIAQQAVDLHEAGMLRLKGHLGEAIRTTAEIMRDEGVSPKDRLSAAKELMSWSKAPAVAVLPVVPARDLAREAARTDEELEAVVVSSRPANDNARGGEG